ncbi:signal peptidase II [Verminephrobacter aporrectodeae subsp. tuberculatae]|uniref:signal peptidase II n=1 Tax=Verminephrobacter aporrectodeae TaxID=1110389 RepID=UPI002237438E|nr:signal peptidase II [Verminephrobacter aporrectodeae]MCW5255803.1 signal peptidase II [Verminephrobacter aporrectodeae subsp. tuberculatae]
MARAALVGRPGARMRPWLVWALLVLLADQISKAFIVGYYQLGDAQTVTQFFNIVRVHNTGAAFSFLSNAGDWPRWLFTGVGLVATVFIVWQLRAHPGQKLFCFALSGILGGAIGNVLDRLRHGHVVDFLQFHHAGWYFPSFNLADAAITLGVACLILDELLRVRRGR